MARTTQKGTKNTVKQKESVNTQEKSKGAEMSLKSEDTAVEKVKKTWVRNRQENFGQENVEPGDNSRYLRLARVAMDLPPIDVSDAKQVEDRINAYFDFCEQNDKKPQKIEMAAWLGIHIDTLISWGHGEYRSKTHSEVVKKADAIMHSLWVDYMMNGKINPGSGIFLGKNMFGYRDVIDIAPTQAPPMGELMDRKALEAKVQADVIVDE